MATGVSKLNRQGHIVYGLREAYKIADAEAQNTAYDAWSSAADELAESIIAAADAMDIGREKLRGQLDCFTRDALLEPAI